LLPLLLSAAAGLVAVMVLTWDARAVSDAPDTGATELASVTRRGGQQGPGPSTQPSMSAGGRWVAFTSNNRLDQSPPAIDGFQHVYRFDRVLGDTVLVSVPAPPSVAGTSTSGASPQPQPQGSEPSISADGNLVAFTSTERLTSEDTNDLPDVYLRDLGAGTTTLISYYCVGSFSLIRPAAALSPSASPAVAPTVAAPNCFPGSEVVASGGRTPSISGNGNFVAYVTVTASGPSAVELRDLRDGTLRLVSARQDLSDVNGNNNSELPSVDYDGGFVAFISTATDLLPPGATPAGSDTNVYRRQVDLAVPPVVPGGGTTVLVGTFALHQRPSIDGDGNLVAFASGAQLLPEDTNTVSDVYLRDVGAGTLTPVSTRLRPTLCPPPPGPTTTFAPPSDCSLGAGQPVISNNGLVVAFSSADPNFVPNDDNLDFLGGGGADVFVWDLRSSPAITRVSLTATGQQSSLGSDTTAPSVSGNGAYVAFESTADNLVPNDTNGTVSDVFIRYRPTVETSVSLGVPLGGAVFDTATLSGTVYPLPPPPSVSTTGGPVTTAPAPLPATITFKLFGPDDSGCARPPVFTSIVPVTNGNADYTSVPFTPVVAGVYRFVATYSGNADNQPAQSPCLDVREVVMVGQATPAITTSAAPASFTVGGAAVDTATLQSGSNPTGTITFTSFGPGDTTCTGAAAFTATVAVNGDGSYPSPPFTPTSTGAYRFIAAYSGDANNAAASTACNDAGEQVVAQPAAPAVATRASPSAAVGNPITDTATVSGGFNPTGTLSFFLFQAGGPTPSPCATSPVSISVNVPVNGDGSYTSPPVTPGAPGTYVWVAEYSGDANNQGVADFSCTDPNERVVVAQSAPTVTTAASGPVALGGSVSDTATVAGGTGFNSTSGPSGTITFSLYGPDDATCTGPPAFTSAPVTVLGGGDYPSGPFTPPTPGSWRWVASYSGDTANAPVTTACADPSESVLVVAAPTLTTQATPPTPGGALTDTATLAGGHAPTGTITFSLWSGPTVCAEGPTAVFTAEPVAVAGNGTYSSPPFTPPSPGIYTWDAFYSGDAGNQSADGPCDDPAESVVVRAVPTVVGQASPPVTVGGIVTDAATVSGLVGAGPGGNIAFALYGPGDATCTGTPVFTTTPVPLGPGGAATSPPFRVNVPGVYTWVASYSGDPFNVPATTACADPRQQVVVKPATAILTTSASGPVALGGAISDLAVLSGLFVPNPAGGASALASLPAAPATLVFRAFGPDDPDCAGPPAFTSAPVPVNGDGRYPSGSFTPVAGGTWRWVASYGGDAYNTSVSTPCDDPAESVVVRALPIMEGQASPAVTVGGSVTDTATLSGLVDPTTSGSITFLLFAPGDTTCAGPALFTSTASVDGDGAYTSAAAVPAPPGTWRWVASYSGDAFNVPATTACSDPHQEVAVNPARPTITTTASAPVALGGTIADTAAVAGLFVPPAPTGNDGAAVPAGVVVFSLYGPDDAVCAGPATFSSAPVPVGSDGSYPSGPFSPTAPGTYRWVASYGGDGYNAPIATACDDPGESVVVSKATPALVTDASGSVAAGGTISDRAILTGGFSPTGTLTFMVYGPGDPTCSGQPALTAPPLPVTGTEYKSPAFTTTGGGIYRWRAEYSGDAANQAVSAPCNDADESVAVSEPRITPGAIDFGPVELLTTSNRTVTVSNVGAGTVIAGTVALSGGDAGRFAIAADTCSGQRLTAADTCTITLTFTPSALAPARADLVVPGAGSVALAGSGVDPPFAVAPDPVDFGGVGVLVEADASVTVTNLGRGPNPVGPLTITGPDAADFAVVSTDCTTSVPSGATCSTLLRFTTGQAAIRHGALEGTFGPGHVPFSVALRGEGLPPEPLIDPGAVDFGKVELGTTSDPRTVTVSNQGAGLMVLGPAALGGTDAGQFAVTADTCSGRVLAPFTDCTVTLTLSPAAVGVRRASLSIPGAGPVGLAGAGVDPPFSVAPSPLDFGAVTVQTSSPDVSVTVTNRGRGANSVGPLSLAGPDSSSFAIGATDCTSPVASGAACSVTLRFYTAEAGPRHASLLGSFGPGRVAFSVALSGAGIEVARFTPILALSPDVGPPGTVTAVAGTGFRPNTDLQLNWADDGGGGGPSPSLAPIDVTTDANGRFGPVPVLLFRHSDLGPRELRARGAQPDDSASASFLVVPGTMEPSRRGMLLPGTDLVNRG